MVGPLAAKPVGGGEEAVGLPEVGLAGVRLGKARHLIHDRVRLGRSHRLTDRHRIQPVHHDAICAQLRQQAQLARARRGSCYLVAPGHQLRHQLPPDDAGPTCYEHPHDYHLLIPDLSLRPETRQPACL
jgi:hypothetical protein